MIHRSVLIALSGLALFAGCSPRADQGTFDSPDPQSRLYAIHRAGDQKDRTAVPHLIDALGSDDQAVRLYAIQALEKITGERKGYVYYAPPQRRQEAIDRWVAAYRAGELGPVKAGAQPAATTTPTGNSAASSAGAK